MPIIKKVIFIFLFLIFSTYSNEFELELIERINIVSKLDKKSTEYSIKAHDLAYDVINFSQNELKTGNPISSSKILTLASQSMPWRDDISNLRKIALKEYFTYLKELIKSEKDCKVIENNLLFASKISPFEYRKISNFGNCVSAKEIIAPKDTMENIEFLKIPTPVVKLEPSPEVKFQLQEEKLKKLEDLSELNNVLIKTSIEILYEAMRGQYYLCDKFNLTKFKMETNEVLGYLSQCELKISDVLDKGDYKGVIYKLDTILKEHFSTESGTNVNLKYPYINKEINFSSTEKVRNLMRDYVDNFLNNDLLPPAIVFSKNIHLTNKEVVKSYDLAVVGDFSKDTIKTLNVEGIDLVNTFGCMRKGVIEGRFPDYNPKWEIGTNFFKLRKNRITKKNPDISPLSRIVFPVRGYSIDDLLVKKKNVCSPDVSGRCRDAIDVLNQYRCFKNLISKKPEKTLTTDEKFPYRNRVFISKASIEKNVYPEFVTLNIDFEKTLKLYTNYFNICINNSKDKKSCINSVLDNFTF